MMRLATVAALALSLAGCITINVSNIGPTTGEGNKPAVRTDADAKQDIKPVTTVPLLR